MLGLILLATFKVLLPLNEQNYVWWYDDTYNYAKILKFLFTCTLEQNILLNKSFNTPLLPDIFD